MATVMFAFSAGIHDPSSVVTDGVLGKAVADAVLTKMAEMTGQ